MFESLNVFGEKLEPCSHKPLTGFYRDGYCNTSLDNQGLHTVCIYATDEFLEYLKEKGNDLITPMPKYNFAGVKAGESWCLSAGWFINALKEGLRPKIFLHSTHKAILEFVDIEILKECALDL